MFEDDVLSEAYFFFHVAAWGGEYFSMLSSNWYFSDYARARRMRMLAVSGCPSFSVSAFCSSSLSSKLPAGRIWKMELR